MSNELQEKDENNIIFDMASMFVNETKEAVFLTGKAGTGKTTFLRHIRRHTLKATVVAAPTGVAAINAEGTTLHSLFQLPFEPYVPGKPVNRNTFRFGKAKLDLLRHLELLIIDEVSMLRADTLDAIDSTLQMIRRSREPFGGVQVVYIGDMFQLPPVVKDDEWELLRPYYQSMFFFHAQVIRRMQPVYLELKKVYRQSEQTFINLLNNVRNNCLTAEDLQILNARYLPDFNPSQSGDKYITLTTHNYKADRINKQELDSLPGLEYKFSGTVTGEFPEYALPTDLELCLKAGAQVMFIKNDPSGRYFNGKIATVIRLSSDRIEVRLNKDETITVNKETWKNIKYTLNKLSGEMDEEETGSYEQYPLRLAWAVTVHKSQGLTFDKAVIDIGDSFAAGQAYVALSRCTSLEGIVLRSPVSPSSIMTDSHAVAFSKTEKPDAELRNILSEGRKKFWRERLIRYFEWKPVYIFLHELDKLLQDKVSDEFEPIRKLSADFRRVANEMTEVSDKFCRQLNTLVSEAEASGNIDTLGDRCCKAVTYFHENTVTRILLPLQAFINDFTHFKRAQTFRKNILELESDIVLFLENMKRVRYNNIPLTEQLPLTIPSRKDMFTRPVSTEVPPAKTPKADPATRKIDTRHLTLTLFNAGMSIEEIATERKLAVSTIEGHLSDFIGEEVLIDRLFTPEELKEILPAVTPILEMEHPAFKPVYEQTEGKYSYGRLKMAFKYLKKMEEKTNI